MKPQVAAKKPLQGRNRTVNYAQYAEGAAQQQQEQQAPRVPRMLRRQTTRQSFMEVDLQYLMRLDPTTPDPFENSSSPLLADPPSLFRPLPTVAAAAQAIAMGHAGPWMFNDVARLEKEQEELRVQYLHFLHQLHQSNPHGFLVHMNTFATEFPQEFIQLQSYIKFQESITNQQQEQRRQQEELARYQAELEKRRQQEQDLAKFQQFQQQQQQQQQRQEQIELLQEWLILRQQHKARQNNRFMLGGQNNKKEKEIDMADMFTLASQKDPQLMERMLASPGGLDLILTAQQQYEFSQFLQQRWIEKEERKRKQQEQFAMNGFHDFSFQQAAAAAGPHGPTTLFGFNFGANMAAGAATTEANNIFSGFGGNGVGGDGVGSNSNSGNSGGQGMNFSRFENPMSNEQYLRKHNLRSGRRY